MTPAWFYAIRAQQLRQGLCPGCGGKITQGYGLIDGHIGGHVLDPFAGSGSTGRAKLHFDKPSTLW